MTDQPSVPEQPPATTPGPSTSTPGTWVAKITRTHLFIAGGIIIAVFMVFLGAYVATNDGVRPGTTVAGTNVGGLSESEAVAVLKDTLTKDLNRPITVNAGEEVFEIRPKAAGITLDAQATIEPALSRGWNPLTVFTDLFGNHELEPVLAVDQVALVEQVASVAQAVDQLPVEPKLKVTPKKITLTPGTNGLQIDQEQLAQDIVAAVLAPREPIEAPSKSTPPRVSEETAMAAEQLAQRAVADPVLVTAGTINASIPPAAIARALSFTQQGSQLSPELDGAKLHKSIAADLKQVEKPGRNATFKIVKGKPVVVPSVVGAGVSNADLATAVLGVIGNPAADRKVTVSLGTREPELTTAQAQQLGINEKLSSFTQAFAYAPYRVTNIGQAAKYVDGTLLMPGETFSMNDTIKERTEKNGYTEGTIIGPGGVFEDALGGGVSAATTAVWTAAFFAGMERTDTRAHSLYISRYQPGLEATVAWGIFDMKFTNDSPTAVFITTKMTNSSMKVTFWGTRQYDDIVAEFGERTGIRKPQKIIKTGKNCSPQTGIEGFTIVVDRVFINNGEEVRREPMRTIYRAGPEIVCKKKPKKDKKQEVASAEDTFNNDTNNGDPSAKPSPKPSAKPSASPSPSKPKKNNND